MMQKKLKIKEAIVVEGRDDTIAVDRAIDGITIETHGFGIKKETWALLEKAYNEKGLIVFTDPDFSGEEIRRKIMQKFPDSKQAFLTRDEAEKKGDIGIENASAEAITAALKKAKCTEISGEKTFTEEDLWEAGLTGNGNSGKRREKLAQILGIGYSNNKTMLKKLNNFGISREAFFEAVRKLDEEQQKQNG